MNVLIINAERMWRVVGLVMGVAPVAGIRRRVPACPPVEVGDCDLTGRGHYGRNETLGRTM